MSMRVGEVALGLKLDTSQYQSQLAGVKRQSMSSTSAISGSFMAMAKKCSVAMAGAFAVGSITKFGQSCISLASDLAEVQNVVDVTFPTMSAQVDEFSRKAQTQFGLSETMAKRFTGTFGSMAEAFGFSEKEALTMAETLTGLAGDVASFYNIDQDLAYTKLKSVFSGETETLKDLGIVMTQTALDQYAMANGFGRTTSAMSEAEKVALRYSFVQSQLANASGDFARTSDSWANQVRILSLQFQTLKANIGTGLIAVLSPVIGWINTFIGKLIQATQVFGAFVRHLFGGGKSKGSQQLASNLADAGASVGGISSGMGGASKGIGKATKQAKKLNRELQGFDQINRLSKKDSTSGSGSSGGSSGAGGGVGGGIPAMELDASSSKADELWKKLKNLIAPSKRLKEAWEKLAKIIRRFGKWFRKNVLQPFGKWLKNKFLPVFIETIASGFEALVSILQLLKPILKFIWDKFLKPFAKQVGKMIVTRLELTKGFFEAISRTAKGLKDAGSTVKEFFSAIPERGGDIVKTVSLEIGTKWSDLESKWTELKKKFTGKTAYIYAKIGSTWSKLKTTWNKLLAKFKGKTVDIKLRLKATVESIKGWINSSIITPLNNKIHQVPLLKKISIPKLASGGFVKANSPALAMIGDNKREGEIVAPESKLKAMAEEVANASGGGRDAEIIRLLSQILTATQNNDIYMDRQKVTNEIVKQINANTKARGGRCAIIY